MRWGVGGAATHTSWNDYTSTGGAGRGEGGGADNGAGAGRSMNEW
jgi:hypothetical protein